MRISITKFLYVIFYKAFFYVNFYKEISLGEFLYICPSVSSLSGLSKRSIASHGCRVQTMRAS